MTPFVFKHLLKETNDAIKCLFYDIKIYPMLSK